MILILSNKWDLTVDFVVAELRARGNDFVRLNTEDLPSGQSTISLPDLNISVSKNEQTIDLYQSTRVIWNRRPGKPYDNLPENEKPSNAIRSFISDQWLVWLQAFQLIPDVTWVNHPQANYFMENKVRQLAIASKLGFAIPNTIISNDPSEIHRLAKKYDGVLIAKALYAPLIEEPKEDYFVFTNEIRLDDLKHEEEIKVCPSIFQQRLYPKIDYRVTVIGESVLAVRIEGENRSLEQIDWRTRKEELRFLAFKLPSEIETLCRRYVTESGLLFGALDLVEYDGQFYFLEINPNGEWGWLQKPNNIPIAETLCDLLASHDAN